MSKIKNGGLDQYDAGPFEQQQFGTAGVEGVNIYRENVFWLDLCGKSRIFSKHILQIAISIQQHHPGGGPNFAHAHSAMQLARRPKGPKYGT